MPEYRYALERSMDGFFMDPKVCLFVMLNPSTADEKVDDPTVRRCMGFARGWGYSKMHVVNLFAMRATDPTEVHSVEDPAGPENDRTILREAGRADLIVLAWGAHGTFRSQDQRVLKLLREAYPDKVLHCLGETKEGHPLHPLYVKGSTPPVKFAGPYSWLHE